jgi:ribose transport system substrate-binding protein
MHKHFRRRFPYVLSSPPIMTPSTLGAIRAAEECGRAEYCAVLSQSSIQGRAELRRPGSPLVGPFTYFPERYGKQLLPLALAILNGTPTPPAVYVRHVLVTQRNVGRMYPHETQTAP